MWAEVLEKNKRKILQELKQACIKANNNVYLYCKVYLESNGDVTTLATYDDNETQQGLCLATFHYPCYVVDVDVRREVKEAWNDISIYAKEYLDEK